MVCSSPGVRSDRDSEIRERDRCGRLHSSKRVVQLQHMRTRQLQRVFLRLIGRSPWIIDIRGTGLLNMSSEYVRYGMGLHKIGQTLHTD